MAKCRRCGANFDYETREGVCPKCCFYNRPSSSPVPDERWMENYDMEDNTYEPPRLSTEEISAGQKREKKSKRNNRDKRPRAEKNRRVERQPERNLSRYRSSSVEGAKKSSKKKLFWILFPLLLIVLGFALVFLGMRSGKEEGTGKQAKKDNLLEVKSISYEEAAKGVQAGDMTYRVGEARVLFEEGELSSMPAGEKCIGIWLENNESVISHYTGFDWKRPYVFDGENYRELVNVDITADSLLFEEKQIERFPEYAGGDGDICAYAIYYVDADTQSVKLSLPCQKVRENNRDIRDYTGVIEVDIPLGE